MRRGAVLLLCLAARAAGAEGMAPGDVPTTPQLDRILAEGRDEAAALLGTLMERIGRRDGLVLATLTEDRDKAREQRIADAVESLLALDKNGDGVLTRLEVARQRDDWSASHLQTFFTEFDTDGTGRVDPAEVETGVRLRAEEVGSTAVLEDLAAWDLNGDGIVAAEEVAAVILAKTRRPR